MPKDHNPEDELDQTLRRWATHFQASAPAPVRLPDLTPQRRAVSKPGRRLMVGLAAAAVIAGAVTVAHFSDGNPSLVGPGGQPPAMQPMPSQTVTPSPSPSPPPSPTPSASPSPQALRSVPATTSPGSGASRPTPSTAPPPTRPPGPMFGPTRITYAAAPAQAYTAGGTLVAHLYRFVLASGATCAVYVNQLAYGDGVAYPYGCSDGTDATPPVQNGPNWTVTLREDAYPAVTGPVRSMYVARAYCIPQGCHDDWNG